MTTAPIVTDEAGRQWYIWDFKAKWAYPYDEDAPVFLLAAPPGGIGVANAPFLVKGDPGSNALIDTTIDFTALEHDDPTPDSAEFVELVPGSDTVSQLSRLVLKLHKGDPGADGASGDGGSGLVFTDNGDSTWTVVVGDGTGDLTAISPAGPFWPTAVSEAGSGTTAGQTLATISIPSGLIPYNWQPRVFGTAIATGSGADVRVDLLARLETTTGPIVGRGYGIGGLTDRLTIVSGPETNVSSATVTVAANAAATILFRTEKQSGSETYSTGASPSRFYIEVTPVS